VQWFSGFGDDPVVQAGVIDWLQSQHLEHPELFG